MSSNVVDNEASWLFLFVPRIQRRSVVSLAINKTLLCSVTCSELI